MRMKDLTPEQQAYFISGYKHAGGYMGDANAGSPYPWCSPWLTMPSLIIDADNAYTAGALYWESVAEEVRLLCGNITN